MKIKTIPAFIALILFTISCAPLFDYVPVEDWDIDVLAKENWKNWVLGHYDQTRNQRIREYIPKGQKIDNWKEIVTSKFIGGRFETSTNIMEAHLLSLAKMLNGFEKNVIEDNGEEALYEWRHTGSKKWPAEHEIVLVRLHSNGAHVLHYSRRGNPMDKETRSYWINQFKNAKIS